MKVFIRFRGSVSFERELDSGREYLLGRSSDCEIRLTQSFISRVHGKVYYRDEQWYYQDLREGHEDYRAAPQKITHDQRIELAGDMELVTDQYLSLHQTVLLEELGEKAESSPRRKFSKATLFVYVGIFCALFIGGGYFAYRTFFEPKDAQELFKLVRPKIVEFEKRPDPAVLTQLKEYANLSDADFREEVGYCSGFIIDQNVVLTASHCVLGPFGFSVEEGLVVKAHDGKRFTPARVLGFDILRDYLFLEVPGLESYESLKLEPDFKIGEKVYTVGNVHGQGIAIREGITASKTKDEVDPTIEFLRFSAAASPGNSGGPLINNQGDVLGLVFARSNFSENYNVATDSATLLAGMEQFVKKQELKKVAITTQDIPDFILSRWLEEMGLIYDYQWSSYPEKTKPLREINVELELPMAFSHLADHLYEGFYTALRETYQQVREAIAKEDKEGLKSTSVDWLAHANEQTPLITPFPAYDRIDIVAANDRYFVDKEFSFYLPSEDYNYRYFKDQLSEQRRYNYIPDSIPTSIVPPALDEKGIPKLQNGDQYSYSEPSYYSSAETKRNLQYAPYLYAWIDYGENQNWEPKRTVSLEERTKMILGDKGLLVSMLQNEFLKANRFNSFTLERMPPAEVEEIQDALGRRWSLAKWRLFGQTLMTQHCLPLPQGYVCYNRSDYIAHPYVEATRAKAFHETVLPQVLLRPYFWATDALLDYLEKGYGINLQGFNDVALQKTEAGALNIKLKTLGLEFTLTGQEIPRMLRIVPAIYHQAGHSRWIAVGFTGYYGASPGKADEFQFCGAEVQLKNMVPYLYSFEELERYGATRQVVTAKDYHIRALGQEGILATYCQPLQKGPLNYTFGLYGPHAIPVTID